MLKYLAILGTALLLSACQREPELQVALALDSRQGQWIVVNYWADWCKPCIHEIPELNALDRTYPGITVLGVNYDGLTGSELAEQVTALGISFPNLTDDPSATLGIERPMVLPTTVIVDPGGSTHQVLVGPQTLDSLAAVTGMSAASAL